MFDCGMVEKVRPVLIFSVPFTDSDRAVVTVVFHSTALRGSQFEVEVKVPFLKDGAFIAQPGSLEYFLTERYYLYAR